MDAKELSGRLKEIVAEICPDLEAGDIDPTVPLTQQGMDSLDVVDYVLMIETSLG